MFCFYYRRSRSYIKAVIQHRGLTAALPRSAPMELQLAHKLLDPLLLRLLAYQQSTLFLGNN